ncbi:zinc finger protein 277 [Culicoides brevitarsis]|uniref:zinc finger protein 277 n=1 Tax=Culicoides brevitarsis TaxID=469753 RepID=UPI00307B8FC1
MDFFCLSNEPELVPCLFCDLSLAFPVARDEYLAHLFTEHRLVIADVQEIKLLPEYLKAWRKSFEGHPIAEYCTTMLLDKTPDGKPSPNEKYYLLSDIVAVDREIRQKVETKYLELVLARHQFEKNDENFEKGCLYCRDVIKGTRAMFLEHLYTKHFLHLGKSENLVFIEELISTVEDKLNNLICIFCEKTFKDRQTLKEHMRKKAHKRINPDNKSYDKFFLVNYKAKNSSPVHQNLSKPKNRQVQKPITSVSDTDRRKKPPERSRVFQTDNSDSDWDQWTDEEIAIVCLFCNFSAGKFDAVKNHMNLAHGFDFDTITEDLNFYQRVKMVNFIRRQVQLKRCVNDCSMEFDTEENLLKHLTTENHFVIRDAKLYNQPQYFFPTIDDDSFLCYLEDTLSEELERGTDDSAIVVTEDIQESLNSHVENYVMENLVKDVV